jgi:hypothetical protein
MNRQNIPLIDFNVLKANGLFTKYDIPNALSPKNNPTGKEVTRTKFYADELTIEAQYILHENGYKRAKPFVPEGYLFRNPKNFGWSKTLVPKLFGEQWFNAYASASPYYSSKKIQCFYDDQYLFLEGLFFLKADQFNFTEQIHFMDRIGEGWEVQLPTDYMKNYSNENLEKRLSQIEKNTVKMKAKLQYHQKEITAIQKLLNQK